MEAGQVSGVRGERAILAGESMIRPLSLSLSYCLLVLPFFFLSVSLSVFNLGYITLSSS